MAHPNGIAHSGNIRTPMETLDSVGCGVMIGGAASVGCTVKSTK